MHEKETLRQLLHLSGVLLVVVPLGVRLSTIGVVLLGMSLVSYIYSEFARRREALAGQLPWPIDTFERIFYETVKEHERDDVPVLSGITTFAFGIGLSLLVFPPNVAALAVISLAVGDAMATLVGVHAGRHPLPDAFNPDKSWEGSMAALVSVFGAAMFYGPVETAAITAITATVVEAIDMRIDDNITIPLITGAVLLLV